jgi:hypothetical protein
MPDRRVLVPVLLLALAACSGGGFDQPKASAFASGSCRDLAPSVLALGKDLHGLGSKPPSSGQREALTKDQGTVRARQASLPSTLAPDVQELVTAVGVLRLRADTNSYEPGLTKTAMSAYTAVVTACT